MDMITNRSKIGEPRYLKIGEVAKLAGIGIETLRFYEKAGVLDRPGRTYSGYRMYDSSVLDRIAFIKQAQVLGFTLEEIKELIRHKRSGENPCKEVRAVVRRRLEELDEKLKQMKKYRAELAATLKEWDSVKEAKGHVCGLIENADIHHSPDKKKKIMSRSKRGFK